MTNKTSHTFLLALLCTTQISTNAFSMDPTSLYELRRTGNERLELLPEIQGKIVTTILDLYLNELEDVIDEHKTTTLYTKWDESPFCRSRGGSAYKLLNKLMYWIQCTRFKPVHATINLNNQSKKGSTLLHHATEATCEDIKHNKSDTFDFTHYLLEHNADPNIQSHDGRTAFFECIEKLNYHRESILFNKLLDLFLQKNVMLNFPQYNDIFVAILGACQYSEIVGRIIKLVDIESFVKGTNNSWNNTSIIMNAIHNFNVEFLRILKNSGFDFDIKIHVFKGALTPLEYALDHVEFRKSLGSLHPDVIKRIDATIELLQSVTNDQSSPSVQLTGQQ